MDGFPVSGFTALPVYSGSSDYYGGSVAISSISRLRLSPFRFCEYSVQLRFPFAPLTYYPVRLARLGDYRGHSSKPLYSLAVYVSIDFRIPLTLLDKKLGLKQYSFDHIALGLAHPTVSQFPMYALC